MNGKSLNGFSRNRSRFRQMERQAWRTVFQWRDQRPIWEWAADNLILKPPFTRTGPFDLATTRHFIAPLEALADDHVREVNILKPVRGGGSLLADIHLPWTIVNDPGPYMRSFQADDVAEDHTKERIVRLLRQCPATARLMPGGKLDWSEIRLLNEFTIYHNGPSLANFQTKGVRYLVLDEPWMYPRGRMGEALARVGDYLKISTSKVFCVSQGGPNENQRIEENEWWSHYHAAELNTWTVQCHGCGAFVAPKFFDQRKDGKWAGLIFDEHKLPNGDWHIARTVPTVRYECPLCGHPHLDTPRLKSEWNRTGQYLRTTEENRRKRSFHWEAVIDYPWVELATMWLEAANAFRRGVIEPKLQFAKKYLAKFEDERTLLQGSVRLPRVSYEIRTDTEPEELGRCMSVDRQEQWYWWTVRKWFKHGKSRRLGFGRAFGLQELEDTRKKFAVEPNNLLIDARFEAKGERGVYAACIRHGWVAIMGDRRMVFSHRGHKRTILRSYSELSFGDPECGLPGGGKKACPLIFFAKAIYNQRVQGLIESGLWEEPAGSDNENEREYVRQMGGRMKKVKLDRATGALKEFWWESQDDHARDLANGQVLWATLARILPDELPHELQSDRALVAAQ